MYGAPRDGLRFAAVGHTARMATAGVSQPGAKRNRFLMKNPEVGSKHESAGFNQCENRLQCTHARISAIITDHRSCCQYSVL